MAKRIIVKKGGVTFATTLDRLGFYQRAGFEQLEGAELKKAESNMLSIQIAEGNAPPVDLSRRQKVISARGPLVSVREVDDNYSEDDGKFVDPNSPVGQNLINAVDNPIGTKVSTKGDTDYEELTVAELKDKARDAELTGFSTMTKDELVKALKKNDRSNK